MDLASVDVVDGNVIIQNKPVSIPWLKVVTSPAVLAIIVAHTTNMWFLHSTLTLPLYMKDVLKFDIKQVRRFVGLQVSHYPLHNAPLRLTL